MKFNIFLYKIIGKYKYKIIGNVIWVILTIVFFTLTGKYEKNYPTLEKMDNFDIDVNEISINKSWLYINKGDVRIYGLLFVMREDSFNFLKRELPPYRLLRNSNDSTIYFIKNEISYQLLESDSLLTYVLYNTNQR